MRPPSNLRLRLYGDVLQAVQRQGGWPVDLSGAPEPEVIAWTNAEPGAYPSEGAPLLTLEPAGPLGPEAHVVWIDALWIYRLAIAGMQERLARQGTLSPADRAQLAELEVEALAAEVEVDLAGSPLVNGGGPDP